MAIDKELRGQIKKNLLDDTKGKHYDEPCISGRRKLYLSVSEAENGYDALEKALSDDFDLMVVDINMPKMDGFTFCREIRSGDKHKDVPIIIISTESEAEDKMKGFKAGANLYLVKPVKAEILIENAKMLLGET